jgi:hypothetical protein
MTNRQRNLILATILLASTPFLLSLPAFLPGIDALLPLLAGVASAYLGLHLGWGDLADL